MNKQHLSDFADFLETVPEEKFWFGIIIANGMVRKNNDLSDGCGSVGCAMGHYPSFNKEWALSSRGIFSKNGIIQTYGYLEAAKDAFDISISEADFLFSPNGSFRGKENNLESHASLAAVVANIRRFLNNPLFK